MTTREPENSPIATVASIAVGKTLGVAPEADLYYVANEHWTDFAYTARGIDRLLDVNQTLRNRFLLVPMDSRCTASIAGLYALACQVDPKVTPRRFWKVALATGETTRVAHDGKD
ncbi:MAG TPA: hypothetical protein VGL40_04335 [Bacillota bacterium]